MFINHFLGIQRWCIFGCGLCGSFFEGFTRVDFHINFKFILGIFVGFLFRIVHFKCNFWGLNKLVMTCRYSEFHFKLRLIWSIVGIVFEYGGRNRNKILYHRWGNL